MVVNRHYHMFRTLFVAFLFLFFVSLFLDLCVCLLSAATPDRSAHATLSKSVTSILALTYFNELLLFNVILLLMLIKLGMVYFSKVRFVPFDVNLNLLRKQNSNTNGLLSKSTWKLLMLLLLCYFLMSEFYLVFLLRSEYASIVFLPEQR